MESRILRRKQCGGWLAFFLLGLAFVLSVPCARQTAAQDLEIKEQRTVANLEERLSIGLRARTEKEQEYVKNVALFVQQGRLPKSLVDSTFLWVQRRKAGGNYPIFYFKRVLKLRAKALRLPVPE